MANLTHEQQHVLGAIVRIGRRRGARPKEIKAAIETGLVESGLRNLPGGDADSAGWRQERASLYRNPTNLKASVNRFFDETSRVRGQYGSSGALAAAVQRPAAQYRSRYGQVAGKAAALLHGQVGGASFAAPQAPAFKAAKSTAPTFDANGYQQAASRATVLTNLISHGNPNNPIAKFGLLAPSMADYMKHGGAAVPEHVAAQAVPRSGPASVQKLIERASAIDAKHYNYEWGGGHNASHAPTHGFGHGSGAGVGFDCSGAVSKVLGINPRVSGQLMSWGKPGEGKHVTIYANGTHTFMKINGKFFGTSGQNPGGGARWYHWHPPASYLAGFVKRHPAGM